MVQYHAHTPELKTQVTRYLKSRNMRKNYSFADVLAALSCAATVSLAAAQTPATTTSPAAKPAASGATAGYAKQVIPPPGPMPTGVVDMFSGMPPAIDKTNLYSEIASGKLSPNVAGALERVYVPNRGANTVSVIDPATLKVIDTFKVGVHPQHIVPSWDLKTLWVANNAEGRLDGSLTPIDPKTGKSGKSIPVDDPYNLYWSPDGKYAIVVAEAYKRLDFRDAKTMACSSLFPPRNARVSIMLIFLSMANLRCLLASSMAQSQRLTWSTARWWTPSNSALTLTGLMLKH